MKKHLRDLIIFALALVGLGVYCYKHIDWDRPQKQNISFVQLNKKIIPLQEVYAEQIPQAVYDGIGNNATYKEFLLADRKQVVLITWNGCPYARAFRQALDQAFKSTNLKDFYKENVVEVPQSSSYSCNSDNLNCPQAWVMNHCAGGFCIINPQTKEAIVDKSQNARQILPLLAFYMVWEKEPLFKTEKNTNN